MTWAFLVALVIVAYWLGRRRGIALGEQRFSDQLEQHLLREYDRLGATARELMDATEETKL